MTDLGFFLPENDLEGIHQAALRILAELGILMEHPEMRDRLAGMGCRIAGSRAYISQEIAARVISQVPSSFHLYGRDGNSSVCVDARGATLFTNSGIVPNICDLESGVIRRSTNEDVARTTRILNALSNVDLVYVSLVDATEAAPHLVTLVDMATTLQNTTKPLAGPGVTNRREAEAIAAMALAMRGNDPLALAERPICAPFIAPITPLTFPVDLVDALFVICKAGLPLTVVTNPVMGVTAPYALAGTAALGHAEVIASAVMAHAVRSGLPILSHNVPSIADMRTLTNTTGGPEVGLLRRTTNQLARYIGIPAWSPAHTSSPALDIQAGDEKSTNSLLSASAQPAIQGGLGGLANITLTSYESLVLDNERFGALKRILRGVTVDEDHLAFEVIADQVAGTEFVTHPHTQRNLRSGEVWMPRLADRRGIVGDCPDPVQVLKRARAEVFRILNSHEVAPLADSTQEQINGILAAYDLRCRAENH